MADDEPSENETILIVPAIPNDGAPVGAPPASMAQPPTQSTPTSPEPAFSFTGFRTIESFDPALNVDANSLTMQPPQTAAGATAQQSFFIVNGLQIKPGHILAAPSFTANSEHTFDAMLTPALYLVATSKSPDGASVFVEVLYINGIVNQLEALTDYGISDTTRGQVSASQSSSFLIMAPHLMDDIKKALSPQSTAHSSILCSPIAIGDSDNKAPSTANILARAKILPIQVMNRNSPLDSAESETKRRLGITNTIDSAPAYSFLLSQAKHHPNTYTSLALHNKPNASLLLAFQWTSVMPAVDPVTGALAHLHPIALRNPKSGFGIDRSISDIQGEVRTLAVLLQIMFGRDHPEDNTGSYLIQHLDEILGASNAQRIRVDVLDEELASTLSRASALFHDQLFLSLPTRNDVLMSFRSVMDSFDIKKCVLENSLKSSPIPGAVHDNWPIAPPKKRPFASASSNGNVGQSYNTSISRQGGHYSATPRTQFNNAAQSPANSRRAVVPRVNPSGTSGGNGPRASHYRPPAVYTAGQTAYPCHNYLADVLRLPNSQGCNRGSSCGFDHTPLPIRGAMSTTDKDALIARVQRTTTRWTVDLISSIRSY
jgi:hypothetical protein